MFQFNLRYFLIFISIFIVEVIIALFIRDNFIRPYFGDYLVIFLVYYFLLSFINADKNKIALGVLQFAFIVETIQAYNILKYFNLEKYKVLRIVAGNTFSFEDLIIYYLAYLTIMVIIGYNEKILSDRKPTS